MLRLTPTKTWMVALTGVTAVASAVALGAGSLAYFSDTQTAPLATVTTGTLTLTINDLTTLTTPLVTAVTNAAPGFSPGSAPLVFKNTGSLPGSLRLHIIPGATNSLEFNQAVQVSFTGLGTPAADAATPAIPSALDGPLTLAQAIAVAPASVPADATAVPAAGNGLTIATLAPGATQNAAYSYRIDPNAGNALQGQTGSFSITADLLQTDDTLLPGNVTGTFKYTGDAEVIGVTNYDLTFSGLTGPTDVTIANSNGPIELFTAKNGKISSFYLGGAVDDVVTVTVPGHVPVKFTVTDGNG